MGGPIVTRLEISLEAPTPKRASWRAWKGDCEYNHPTEPLIAACNLVLLLAEAKRPKEA